MIGQDTRIPSSPSLEIVQTRFPVGAESCELSPDHQPQDLDTLRAQIMQHLEAIGLTGLGATPAKQAVRQAHAPQRQEARSRIVRARGPQRVQHYALHCLADGRDVQPDSIQPEIELVDSTRESGDIFHFATLFWSIPVTPGYGRRMRFLVWDRQNDKLIGAFALCDPVFNLKKRDDWIGWGQAQRRVHTMSAYVAGALPPYSQLLGGKLVTSLAASAEVGQHFRERYGDAAGVISGEKKDAHLVLVTFTSALSRSSIYNRVKLLDAQRVPVVHLRRLGYTQGFGHFQVTDEHFQQLKALVEGLGGRDWSAEMGTGPNWRIRVLRTELRELGIDGDKVLLHGIRRVIFALPVADNARAFLRGDDTGPAFDRRRSAEEISQLAGDRWVVPRARRLPGYQSVSRDELIDSLQLNSAGFHTQPHWMQRILPL